MDMLGNKFLDSNNKNVELSETKIILLYFSSYYCPPCKKFFPVLKDIYEEWNSNNEDNKIEIVYLSCDKSIEDYKGYTSQMPWVSLPYEAEEVDNLAEKYQIQGVPILIALKKDGTIITKNGRKVILEKGIEAIDEWMK